MIKLRIAPFEAEYVERMLRSCTDPLHPPMNFRDKYVPLPTCIPPDSQNNRPSYSRDLSDDWGSLPGLGARFVE
jgi:hypothetical protein